MTWKKTAINSYSKKDLLEIIFESVKKHKFTICSAEMYTMGRVGTALAECTYNLEGGFTNGMNSPYPKILDAILEMGGKTHLYTDKNAIIAAKCSRNHHDTDYSVFVSEPNEKSEHVLVCAVSKLRTYTKIVELTEDEDYNISQVRYHAIYELARLIYNEINQATPPKERGRVL